VTRRAYVYFVLTFLLGIILGGSGVFYYGWYSGRWKHDFDLNRVVDRMKKDLSLDDSQVTQLRQILQESGRKRKDLQQKNHPQFEALHEATRNEIRKILNPDQLAKFNEHVRRSDEKMKQQKSP